MSEYIDRDKTIRYLNSRTGNFIDNVGKGWNAGMEAAIGAIKKIPAAEVVLVVHSHWEVAIGYDPKKKVQCQHCRLMNYEPEDYCPHCGARMDGEPNNDT